MQMQLKVLKLDLFYNSASTGIFWHELRYLSPFAGEAADHFCRRLLSYVLLYELHPTLALQPIKGPDLYLQDDNHHYQLWCQVDPPSDKQLQKACHQSDQVVLMLQAKAEQRFSSNHRRLPNVQVCSLSDETIDQCQMMLKAGMQWNVWREELQLQVTDGEFLLELTLPSLPMALH